MRKNIVLTQVFRVNRNFLANQLANAREARSHLIEFITPIKDTLRLALDSIDILAIIKFWDRPEIQAEQVVEELSKAIEIVMLRYIEDTEQFVFSIHSRSAEANVVFINSIKKAIH